MNLTDDHWLNTATRHPIHGGALMATRRLLVIHHTAGASALSSIAWWKKLANGVCAQFVIDRDGTIYQCRPCNQTAGHAGTSRWRDPKTGLLYHGLNKCSISIELANGGSSFPTKFSTLPPVKAAHKHGGPAKEWEAYPKAQVDACEALSKVLVARYHLDDIIGHEDCSPGRKTDPGPAFDMLGLRNACGFTGLPADM
jgi:N-acetylmuramoyl-L-alanine amidase